jgi:transposase
VGDENRPMTRLQQVVLLHNKGMSRAAISAETKLMRSTVEQYLTVARRKGLVPPSLHHAAKNGSKLKPLKAKLPPRIVTEKQRRERRIPVEVMLGAKRTDGRICIQVVSPPGYVGQIIDHLTAKYVR